MFQYKNIYGRVFLSLVLCYFIYGETGWATAFGFGLIAFSMELISWWMGEVNKILKLLTDK